MSQKHDIKQFRQACREVALTATERPLARPMRIPPYWELISPDGLVLEFGPGVRWQISSADVPVSARR
jgi:hypothetical protein